MSEHPSSTEFPDNEQTDELPVLSEAAMAAMDADVPTLADAVSSETGEHTAQLLVPRKHVPDRRAGADSSKPPHIEALERDIAALAARWSGVEQHLDKNAAAIGALSEQLASTQRALDNSNAAQQQLIKQLEERESGLATAQQTLEDSHIAREQLLSELASKDERIAALELDLEQAEAVRQQHSEAGAALERVQGELEAARQRLTQELAHSEGRVEALEHAVKAAEAKHVRLEVDLANRAAELAETKEAELENLATQKSQTADLEARDQALAALRQELESERERTAELDKALELAQAQHSRAQTTLERERQKAHTHQADSAGSAPDLDAYRNEIAALSAYIDNRRAEWDELHANLADHKTRIVELERELAQRTEKQLQLEETVQQETARATELGSQLAALKGTLGEQRAALAAQAVPDPQDAAALDAANARAVRLLADVERLEATIANQHEVLQKRAAELDAANAARNALQDELSAAHHERERSWVDLEALEQSLVDEGSDGQNARIATLQRELGERIEALRKLQESEPVGEVVAIDSRRSDDKSASRISRPMTFVCLTNERPEAYDLDKPEMTIGRSSTCDIQILTHFVSREHAKLHRNGETVFIEDLRSTNGVFVNAIRVERQQLRHGDWVTIGETQFRFLDEAAT